MTLEKHGFKTCDGKNCVRSIPEHCCSRYCPDCEKEIKKTKQKKEK